MIAAARRLDRLLFGPLHDRLPRLLSKLIGSAQTVLDVGCGDHSPLWLTAPRLQRLVGVDGFAPYQERNAVHHERIVADVRHWLGQQASKSFDVVVCLDVIEHLEKAEAFAFLAHLERIARRRVIVMTPTGFMPQGEVDGNPYQRHRSGWRPFEFVDRGYRVIGHGGFRPLKGECAHPRFWPRPLWGRVAMLTDLVFSPWPGLCFEMLAVKEIA